MNDKFKALVVREENGKFLRRVEERNINDFPKNDVLINVKYSSLNYKDALSASGNKGVTRIYPHTPGIDAAGIVVSSSNKLFKKGDEVIVTGYELGTNTSGGFGEYISVPLNWIVSLPKNLSLKESMIYGTAGFTSALSLYKLEENGLAPSSGEVLVTGASGGVGSMAISILAKAGYNATALTGKLDKENYLISLGAKKIIDRESFNEISDKALLKAQWDSVIDTVGGEILSRAIKSTKPWGSVAVCGNAASPNLNLTVYPLILRGVNLLGIDSANCPAELRKKIWQKISNEWKLDNLDKIHEEISLQELSAKIDLILKGQVTGRVIVNFKNK